MTNETRTPSDHCGIVEVDPADFTRIDARGLAFAVTSSPDDMGGDICTNSFRNPDGPALFAIIEAQSATIEAVQKVRDGYAGQIKFCDIEAHGYFREFIRRIDAALAPKEG